MMGCHTQHLFIITECILDRYMMVAWHTEFRYMTTVFPNRVYWLDTIPLALPRWKGRFALGRDAGHARRHWTAALGSMVSIWAHRFRDGKLLASSIRDLQRGLDPSTLPAWRVQRLAGQEANNPLSTTRLSPAGLPEELIRDQKRAHQTPVNAAPTTKPKSGHEKWPRTWAPTA